MLFNQPFHDNTVDGPAGSVSLPAAPTGTNVACLSAAGNATANPLASCSSRDGRAGFGQAPAHASAATGQEGGVFASTSVPTSQGLDVTFNSYQYGGNGADGHRVRAGRGRSGQPGDTRRPSGQSGGSLGYSA